jgi:tetratricopeptide (TPR) repeat protein
MAKKGDVDPAITRLQVLMMSSPEAETPLQLARAQILLDAHRPKDAMKYLNEAITKHPDKMEYYYSRAQVAAEMHNLTQAESDLQTILKKDPNNADALNALGYALTNLSTRYAEAQNYILKAAKLSHNNAAIIDSLGWVEYHLGQYDQAITNLQKAYKLNPDPEIAAHLGEALWKKGSTAQANEIWNKALETSPKHPLLLDAIKRNRK